MVSKLIFYRLLDGVGCGPVGTPTTTQPAAGDQTTFHSIGRSSGGGRVGGRSGGKTIGCSGCGCGPGPPMSTKGGAVPPQKPSGGPPGIGPPPTSRPVRDAIPWITTCSVALTSPSLVVFPVIVPTIVIGTAAMLFGSFYCLLLFTCSGEGCFHSALRVDRKRVR
jgi:hypothetical protein